MTPSGGGYSSSGERRSFVEMNNLREEQDERHRLEKSNFDLKMKLFYLESNTKRERSHGIFEDTEVFPPNTSVQHPLSQHSTYLQPPSASIPHSSGFLYQLEEKSSELEQRNQLLVRAKQAIESLKSELEKLRIDSKERSDDLEAQLRAGKLENDEIIYKIHENSLAYESQITKATHLIANKEHLRAAAEEKLVRTVGRFLFDFAYLISVH